MSYTEALCCLGSARLVLHSLVYSLIFATLCFFFFFVIVGFYDKPGFRIFGCIRTLTLFVMRAIRLLVWPAA